MKDPAEVTKEVLDELIMGDIKDGNKEVLDEVDNRPQEFLLLFLSRHPW